MIGKRPILKDETQKESSTNPDFVRRVDDALTQKWVEETAFIDWAKEKDKLPRVKGVSEYETSLMQRIAAVTEQPSNNTAFRTQQRIEDHQKWVNKNLKEDLAREKAYAKELQGYLN